MGKVIKEIDKLYDTYLGKFKAFRQFLTTLRDICYVLQDAIEKQNRDNDELWKEIRDLQTVNTDLQTQIDQKLAAPKDTEGFMTAGKLMDKFHASQQVTN